MDPLGSSIKTENLTLTQQNLTLRNQIASLRKDRLDLQYRLVEAIGAKESFKIDVIKLITQTQNTFERLKTFIEHTTTTPPPPMLSGTEKLLRRHIAGCNNQQQQQQQQQTQTQSKSQSQSQQRQQQEGGGSSRQIVKDTKQMTTVHSQITTPANENEDMHHIDEKFLKLNKILKKYKSDLEKEQLQAKDECKNRRYSKRLQSIASSSGKQSDDNSQLRSVLKDINQTTGGGESRKGKGGATNRGSDSVPLEDRAILEDKQSPPTRLGTTRSGGKRRKILV